MNFKYLLVEDKNHIRTITLNRPDSMNAINYDLLDELEEVIGETKLKDDLRVVVLKGEGRAFCAGDDLKGMGTEKTPIPAIDLKRAEIGYPRFISSIRNLCKPVIAQVHGYALGAGCDLALSCDLVFAAKETKFGLVFANRGMVSGTVLLPKLVGYHKACEILFTGDMFTAEQALEMGMVNAVAGEEEVSSLVDAWAHRLAKAPTGALGMMKRAINQSIGESLERSIDLQRYIMAISYKTHDFNEGRKAFIEKREPEFTGM